MEHSEIILPEKSCVCVGNFARLCSFEKEEEDAKMKVMFATSNRAIPADLDELVARCERSFTRT